MMLLLIYSSLAQTLLQAKWQLKGPPGVSVTPVSRKSTNVKEVELNLTNSSTVNHEHFNKSTPSVAITNIRPVNQIEFNGEEQLSNTHISTSMQNIFNQDDSEREHDMFMLKIDPIGGFSKGEFRSQSTSGTSLPSLLNRMLKPNQVKISALV